MSCIEWRFERAFSLLKVSEIIEKQCVKNVTALRLDKPLYTNSCNYKTVSIVAQSCTEQILFNINAFRDAPIPKLLGLGFDDLWWVLDGFGLVIHLFFEALRFFAI